MLRKAEYRSVYRMCDLPIQVLPANMDKYDTRNTKCPICSQAMQTESFLTLPVHDRQTDVESEPTPTFVVIV